MGGSSRHQESSALVAVLVLRGASLDEVKEGQDVWAVCLLRQDERGPVRAEVEGVAVEVSCFAMDLCCDCENELHEHQEFPHTYTGNNRTECARNAKRDGWRFLSGINGGAKTACPKCRELEPRESEI